MLVGCTQVGGETPLILAAENDAVDVLETLLHSGASVDIVRANGDSALIAAATHDFKRSVALLLEHKASAAVRNMDGDSAVTRAASEGAAGALQLLLAAPGAVSTANAPNTKEGCDAVVGAAKGNHLRCLELLLDAGCSPDVCRVGDGESAIMVSARFESHLPCAKVGAARPGAPTAHARAHGGRARGTHALA